MCVGDVHLYTILSIPRLRNPAGRTSFTGNAVAQCIWCRLNQKPSLWPLPPEIRPGHETPMMCGNNSVLVACKRTETSLGDQIRRWACVSLICRTMFPLCPWTHRMTTSRSLYSLVGAAISNRPARSLATTNDLSATVASVR